MPGEIVVPDDTTIPDFIPTIQHGFGSSPESGGCIMQITGWFKNGAWDDAPDCVMPFLRSMSVRVNDAVSDEARQRMWLAVPRLLATGDIADKMPAGFDVEFMKQIIKPLMDKALDTPMDQDERSERSEGNRKLFTLAREGEWQPHIPGLTMDGDEHGFTNAHTFFETALHCAVMVITRGDQDTGGCECGECDAGPAEPGSEWIVSWFNWMLDVFDEMTDTKVNPAVITDAEWKTLADMQNGSVDDAKAAMA
jgi:hypothetical protein